MADLQHNWRLISESFDRELSFEELNRLEHFMAEHETPREFEELLKRIRGCTIHQQPIVETDSSLNQHLSDQKKIEIQRLLESAIEKQE